MTISNTMKPKKITPQLPAILLRLGVLICFFCISIFFFLSWLLAYKDTISGEITITTNSIPLDLHVKETGKIQLLTKNNSIVTKGTPLGYIENAASLEDCLYLTTHLDSLSSSPSIQSIATIIDLFKQKQLGMNQPEFITLENTYKTLQLYNNTNKLKDLVSNKKEQIAHHKSHIELVKQKIKKHKENVALAKKQLLIDQQLFEEQVLSEREMEQKKQAYNDLSISGRLIDFQASINNSNIAITAQKEAILLLSKEHEQKKEQLENELTDAYQRLSNQLANWKEKYLLIADINGQVVYSDFLSNHEFIQKGTPIMTITPTEEQQVLGLLQLPMVGISKVKEGQSVQIRLDHYPYTEFGTVSGKVASISKIPNNKKYIIQVAFPEGLRSTYDIDFDFKQLMLGQADVITNRLSIWDRLLNQIKSARLND